MYVSIHVDADPNDCVVCRIKANKQARRRSEGPKWDGLVSALGFLEKLAEKLERFGFSFKSTFFLRADEQIKAFYGTYSEVFRMFYDELGQFFSVGWHPHLYRWSESHHCWCQEYRDNEWMRRVLTACYEDVKSHGFRVGFSKMGWCFHNRVTMETLSGLGIDADFSALPGARSPGRLECGVSLQNRFDWSKTRPQPYHPSKSDYQRPGDLKILEIPLTTHRVRGPLVFLSTIKLALSSYSRLDFSYFPSWGVMVPLFLPELAKKHNLEEMCELMLNKKESDYIAIYLHPEDLLEAQKQKIFENLILHMVSRSHKQGVKISFVDAFDLYNRSV